MIRIKKILYPTDFSSYSNQAYFHAIALAENHKASLTVLFVYNPDSITTPGTQGDELADRRYWRGQLEQIRPVNARIPVRMFCWKAIPPRKSSAMAATPAWT